MKLKWQLLLFTLAHILVFLVVFKSGLYDQRFSAAGLYLDFASRTFQGQIPYKDFPMEYPPMALVFFLLPRLLTSNITAYSQLFTVEILFFDLVGLFLLESMARHLRLSVWKTLTFYTIALLSIGTIVDLRYDIMPAVMVLLALLTFYMGKPKTTFAILAIGTLTKIYPVIVAPIFLLYYLRQRQYKNIFTGIGAFAAITALVVLPFIFLSRTGFMESFAYHAERGLQLESTYSSILLLAYNLRLMPLALEFSYGSWNLASPLADTLAKLSTFITVLALGVVYWFYYKNQAARNYSRAANYESSWDGGYTVNYTVLSILAFMVAGKVLSPQYIVWLYPLVPLTVGSWRNGSFLIFVILGIMTYYIFPLHYIDLLSFGRIAIDVLLWRNILLVVYSVILLWTSRREVGVPLAEYPIPTTVDSEISSKAVPSSKTSLRREECQE